MFDTYALLHTLQVGDAYKKCKAASQLSEELKSKPAMIDPEVCKALLERLVDPVEESAVFEAVLLCIAEIFTPATRQDALTSQKHLRHAAEWLVHEPDEFYKQPGATLPCQLAYHLLTETSGAHAPTVLAIARIAVALAENLSASNEHTLLDSEVMQALMVAVARPVGKRSNSGVLCALALFHFMMISPKMLHTALGRYSTLVPSLCSLLQHVVMSQDSTLNANPSSCKFKVQPSDCVSLLLHIVHMEPWVKHHSIHKDLWRKLVLQRVCDSQTVMGLVTYMELEIGSLQEVMYDCAGDVLTQLKATFEQLRLDIDDREHELDGLKVELELCRIDLRRIRHKEAPYNEKSSLALSEDFERASKAKAEIKDQVHTLKHKLSYLRAQQRLLGQHTSAATPRLQKVMGQNSRQDGLAAAKGNQQHPNLGVLVQAISTLAQLASPLATANKGPDPELDQLRFSIHHQMLKTNFLPVSLHLARTAEALGSLVRVLKTLLYRLSVAEDTIEQLAAAEHLIKSHLTHLNGMATRLSFQLKQVSEELHRISKAKTYGTAHGTKEKHVPLTPENTLCPGIRPKDLAKREAVLQEEKESLEVAALAVAGTAEVLEKQLGQLQERRTALTPWVSTEARAPPSPQKPHMIHQRTSPRLGLGQEKQQGGGQHLCSALLSLLSDRLPVLASPERAVDHLHDLLLPPYQTTLKHMVVLTSSTQQAMPKAGNPSAAAAASSAVTLSIPRTRQTEKTPLGLQQQQHIGQYQALEFKALKVTPSPSFHASPRQSRHASAAFYQSPAKSQENFEAHILGPDLNKATLQEQAMRLLAKVHASVSPSPLPCASHEDQQDQDQNAKGLGHQPLLFVNSFALCQQSSNLEAILSSLSALSSLCHSLSTSSRMLPTYCSFKDAKPKVLTDPPELLPDLMASFAACIAHHKSNGRPVAQTVTEIAKKGLTAQTDYVRVYINTGILDALIQQVCHDGGNSLSKFHTSIDDQTSHELSRDFYEKLPRQQKTEGSPSKAAEVSRYTLVVPTLRPSGPGVACQAAAAQALTEIGKSHPEALNVVSSDKDAFPSLCELSLDNSQEAAARMSAAALIAAAVCAGSEDCAELALRKGAFEALLNIMDSDHRQGSDGAKAWVVAALVAIGTRGSLRSIITEIMPPKPQHTKEGLHGSDGGFATDWAERAGRSNPGPKQRAAAQKLIRSCNLQTEEHVQAIVLRTLWAVPLQLVALLSTDAAKGGKTVEPATIGPLNHLGELAAKAITTLIVEDSSALRIAKRMAIAGQINIIFLQSIKDADLHEALIGLKAQLQAV